MIFSGKHTIVLIDREHDVWVLPFARGSYELQGDTAISGHAVTTLPRSNMSMVKGTFGEYTIHLGGGKVQMTAAGSPAILLAEDEKIKDPAILTAIQG